MKQIVAQTRFLVTLSFISMSISCGLMRWVSAGEFNPTRDLGYQVQGWTPLPAADGQQYSMDDFKDSQALVVVFTCNSCPYAVDYEDRINALAQNFAERQIDARLVAINANKIEADQLPAMQKRAAEKSFHFAYLWDESQQVPKEFGAVRTPEFFVLNQDRRIVYMGAMDDNTKAGEVTKKYVEAAVEAVLTGKPVATAETAPIGCLIRFERVRRK